MHWQAASNQVSTKLEPLKKETKLKTRRVTLATAAPEMTWMVRVDKGVGRWAMVTAAVSLDYGGGRMNSKSVKVMAAATAVTVGRMKMMLLLTTIPVPPLMTIPVPPLLLLIMLVLFLSPALLVHRALQQSRAV